jgi:hypothetical protein
MHFRHVLDDDRYSTKEGKFLYAIKVRGSRSVVHVVAYSILKAVWNRTEIHMLSTG